MGGGRWGSGARASTGGMRDAGPDGCNTRATYPTATAIAMRGVMLQMRQTLSQVSTSGGREPAEFAKCEETRLHTYVLLQINTRMYADRTHV